MDESASSPSLSSFVAMMLLGGMQQGGGGGGGGALRYLLLAAFMYVMPRVAEWLSHAWGDVLMMLCAKPAVRILCSTSSRGGEFCGCECTRGAVPVMNRARDALVRSNANCASGCSSSSSSLCSSYAAALLNSVRYPYFLQDVQVDYENWATCPFPCFDGYAPRMNVGKGVQCSVRRRSSYHGESSGASLVVTLDLYGALPDVLAFVDDACAEHDAREQDELGDPHLFVQESGDAWCNDKGGSGGDNDSNGSDADDEEASGSGNVLRGPVMFSCTRLVGNRKQVPLAHFSKKDAILEKSSGWRRTIGKLLDFGINPNMVMFFAGLPGTGKTHAAKTLALHLNMHLIIVKGNMVRDVKTLRRILNSETINGKRVPFDRRILLWEDVDQTPWWHAMRRRDLGGVDKERPGDSAVFSADELLQCLDGIEACQRPGQLYIFTSNSRVVRDPGTGALKMAHLDDAFNRRFKHLFLFEALPAAEVRDMFEQWFERPMSRELVAALPDGLIKQVDLGALIVDQPSARSSEATIAAWIDARLPSSSAGKGPRSHPIVDETEEEEENSNDSDRNRGDDSAMVSGDISGSSSSGSSSDEDGGDRLRPRGGA